MNTSDFSPKIKKTFKVDNSRLTTVCISPDQTKLCSSGSSNIIYLWDLTSNEKISEYKDHTSTVWHVDFSPSGRLLASGSQQSVIRIWDTQTQDGNSFVLKGHDLYVYTVLFTSDERHLVSGSWDDTIKFWDIEMKKSFAQIETKMRVLTIDISPDEKTILSGGSRPYDVELWDFRTKKKIHSLEGHSSYVNCVQFHPNGTCVASAADDCSVKLFDIRNFKLLHQYTSRDGFEENSQVYAVSFHPNGKYIVCGLNVDKNMCVFDISQEKFVSSLKGHDAVVTAIQFSTDGNFFVSSSHDEKLILWELKKDFSEYARKDEEERVNFLTENESVFATFEVKFQSVSIVFSKLFFF